jgi:hypothetical protein
MPGKAELATKVMPAAISIDFNPLDENAEPPSSSSRQQFSKVTDPSDL